MGTTSSESRDGEAPIFKGCLCKHLTDDGEGRKERKRRKDGMGGLNRKVDLARGGRFCGRGR